MQGSGGFSVSGGGFLLLQLFLLFFGFRGLYFLGRGSGLGG